MYLAYAVLTRWFKLLFLSRGMVHYLLIALRHFGKCLLAADSFKRLPKNAVHKHWSILPDRICIYRPKECCSV